MKGYIKDILIVWGEFGRQICLGRITKNLVLGLTLDRAL